MGLQYLSEESSAPTSPASGQVVLYPKTDHFLYWKDSTGAVRTVIQTTGTLTSGRVPYATTSGVLTDDANLTYDGTTLAVASTKFTVLVASGNVFTSGSVSVGAAAAAGQSLRIDSSVAGQICVYSTARGTSGSNYGADFEATGVGATTNCGIFLNASGATNNYGFQINAGLGLFAASTTGVASVRIPSGTAPTSPVDGDMWYDGTNIKFRVGGTTKTFTIT